MAVSLLHTFVNPASDLAGFPGTKPSNWNAQHALTGTANSVLGYDGSGNALDGNLFWGLGILAGGTAAGSTLTLESTTGAGSGDAIFFKTALQVERMRIDGVGQIIANQAGSIAIGGGVFFQANSVDGSNQPGAFQGYQWSNDATAIYFAMSKSRGTTVGSHTIVSNNDGLGTIFFSADNGTSIMPSAEIFSQVDAAPVSGQRVAGRLQFGTALTNGSLTERMRIDSSGHVTIGGFAAIANGFGNTPALQIAGSIGSTSGTQIARYSADASAPVLYFLKSRNATVGSNTGLSANDQIGFLEFEGADATAGSLMQESASMVVSVDAAPTAGSVAGRFAFLTSASGSGSATEAVRIDSSQRMVMGGVAAQHNAQFESNLNVNSEINMSLNLWFNSTGNFTSSTLDFCRSFSTTIGTQSAVAVEYGLGQMNFRGSDGTSFQVAAAIYAICDGTVAASQVPGRLEFFTSNATGSNTEAMRIDKSQFITMGGHANVTTSQFEINNNSTNPFNFAVNNWNSSATLGGFTFNYSGSSTIGTQSLAPANAELWQCFFNGSNGTGFKPAAELFVEIDGTPSSTSMPGRFKFFTTSSADATFTPIERLRIDNTGQVVVGGASGAGYSTPAQAYFNINATSSTPFDMTITHYTNDTLGGNIQIYKTRATTINSNALVSNNDQVGALSFYADGGAGALHAALIGAYIDGTPSNTAMPSRLEFFTVPAGTTTFTERMRIDNAGAVYLIGIGTTTSAANAFINNASSPVNSVLRSTSSLRYKGDVRDVPINRTMALTALRPIEFKSLAPADDPTNRYVGYAAEEVALIDPTLVNYDEHGRPDGVQYDRVLLLKVAALEAELKELKSKLN